MGTAAGSMEIRRGAPALSSFRVQKILDQSVTAGLPIENVYAEFMHFVDLSGSLTDAESDQLGKLLTYGPTIEDSEPTGQLFLVVPRPGTISPWSSKATDIARNTGLTNVKRCLLYTSPSPRDATLSRMPSSA